MLNKALTSEKKEIAKNHIRTRSSGTWSPKQGTFKGFLTKWYTFSLYFHFLSPWGRGHIQGPHHIAREAMGRISRSGRTNVRADRCRVSDPIAPPRRQGQGVGVAATGRACATPKRPERSSAAGDRTGRPRQSSWLQLGRAAGQRRGACRSLSLGAAGEDRADSAVLSPPSQNFDASQARLLPCFDEGVIYTMREEYTVLPRTTRCAGDATYEKDIMVVHH